MGDVFSLVTAILAGVAVGTVSGCVIGLVVFKFVIRPLLEWVFDD